MSTNNDPEHKNTAGKRQAVRYCGGCRLTYDRNRARCRIEKWLDETLEPAREGVHYDTVYLLCGCSAACVTAKDLQADHFLVITEMPDEEDLGNMR